MQTRWLPGARVRDLTGASGGQRYGNGPFAALLGVVLHVNVDESGTPISFWGPGNGGSVTPNFQVFKDGSVDQMLPFDWQPWCQVNGNFNYAAIETAGLPDEPLTDAQCASIARIYKVYHDEGGVPLNVADTPGVAGFGVHSMGGADWGGHSCPGSTRAAQRRHILDLITAAPTPAPTPQEDSDVDVFKNRDRQALALLVTGAGIQILLSSPPKAPMPIAGNDYDAMRAHAYNGTHATVASAESAIAAGEDAPEGVTVHAPEPQSALAPDAPQPGHE